MYKEPQALTSVSKFMKAFNQPVLEVPTIPSADRCELRVKLIVEEAKELEDAIKAKDIVEIADALGDLQYVLSGAIHEFGLGSRFCSIFDNIHSSNMSKICNSYEEAAETLKHYKAQGIEVHSEKLEGDTYIIKRTDDNKVLKNLYYTPATLTKLVKGEHENVELLPVFMQKLLHKQQELLDSIITEAAYIGNGMPGADEVNKILIPLQYQAICSYHAVLSARIKSLQIK